LNEDQSNFTDKPQSSVMPEKIELSKTDPAVNIYNDDRVFLRCGNGHGLLDLGQEISPTDIKQLPTSCPECGHTPKRMDGEVVIKYSKSNYISSISTFLIFGFLTYFFYSLKDTWYWLGLTLIFGVLAGLSVFNIVRAEVFKVDLREDVNVFVSGVLQIKLDRDNLMFLLLEKNKIVLKPEELANDTALRFITMDKIDKNTFIRDGSFDEHREQYLEILTIFANAWKLAY